MLVSGMNVTDEPINKKVDQYIAYARTMYVDTISIVINSLFHSIAVH